MIVGKLKNGLSTCTVYIDAIDYFDNYVVTLLKTL